MPDREKVISEIVERIESSLAVDSEYVNVPLDLLQYALAMLKEQEHKDRMFHALEDDWKRLKELLKEKEAEDEPTFDDWTKGEGR